METLNKEKSPSSAYNLRGGQFNHPIFASCSAALLLSQIQCVVHKAGVHGILGLWLFQRYSFASFFWLYSISYLCICRMNN